MKKTIILKKILVLILGATIVSCSFTDGINESPNDFTDSPGTLLIGQASLEVIKLSESQSSRASGIFTDQFTGSDRQYVSLNKYLTTAGDYDDDWYDLYVYGLAQAQLAEQKAKEGGNKILVGVAQIHKAFLFGEAAALWGDVPYTEALDEVKFPMPKYDKQSFVLAEVQKLLDNAISNVGDIAVSSLYGSPIFVSNEATWKEIAHSLKARYYLVAKNYPKALQEAKKGISSSSKDWLASHSNASGSKNMYFQFAAEQREGYLTANNSYLYRLVTGEVTRKLATPGDAERAKAYFAGSNLNTGTDGYFAVDASFPIVTYVETKLIEAEAAARTGEDALSAFNAVRDELKKVYGGDFPHSSSTGNDLLLEILEEKYISLIGSLQVFHDVRRTKNAIGVPIKGTGATKIPQRFLYSQSEINSNKNMPAIVDLFEETEVNK